MKAQLVATALVALLAQHAAPASPIETTYCAEGHMPGDGQVVMLATSWCPYCAKARAWLKKHKVDYCEYDVEQSATGQVLQSRAGSHGIPVIFMDGEVIHGYDVDELRALLRGRLSAAPRAHPTTLR